MVAAFETPHFENKKKIFKNWIKCNAGTCIIVLLLDSLMAKPDVSMAYGSGTAGS